jgi:ribulose-bisphosphate carboxylase small chain
MALSMKMACSSSVAAAKPAVSAPRCALRPAVKAVAPVRNVVADNKFRVWVADNNKFFETFSFLPPLTSEQIAKQVDYIVNNGWVPALEFASADSAYTSDVYAVRLHGTASGYYDNRYWSMWKLPMFGCTDASQVLKEIASASKAFPDAYVRLVAFDSVRQVQIAGFLVQRPKSAKDYRPVAERSVA